MEITLIIAAVAVVGALAWYFLSRKKDRQRLDKLHITGAEDRKS